MNSLVWELASVRLEKALTSYCVCVCMWADIINTGVNDNFFSHSTGSWIESLLSESLLRNHRFKQNDLLDFLCYEYWQIIHLSFPEAAQCLVETIYSIFLLMEYRDKLNFYQMDIVITCISFIPSNLSQDWDYSRCWLSAYSLYFSPY